MNVAAATREFMIAVENQGLCEIRRALFHSRL
jgi:hypothetical protein